MIKYLNKTWMTFEQHFLNFQQYKNTMKLLKWVNEGTHVFSKAVYKNTFLNIPSLPICPPTWISDTSLSIVYT